MCCGVGVGGWNWAWVGSGEMILRINPVKYFSKMNVLKETNSEHWDGMHMLEF